MRFILLIYINSIDIDICLFCLILILSWSPKPILVVAILPFFLSRLDRWVDPSVWHRLQRRYIACASYMGLLKSSYFHSFLIQSPLRCPYRCDRTDQRHGLIIFLDSIKRSKRKAPNKNWSPFFKCHCLSADAPTKATIDFFSGTCYLKKPLSNPSWHLFCH